MVVVVVDFRVVRLGAVVVGFGRRVVVVVGPPARGTSWTEDCVDGGRFHSGWKELDYNV